MASNRFEKIALHVGPGKCGSTSIQRAIINRDSYFNNNISGIFIKPGVVVRLDNEVAPDDVEKAIDIRIKKKSKEADSENLMISHESFFKMPRAVRNMVKIANKHCGEVVVILYVRKQSELIVSSFGQWIFRDRDRIIENNKIIEDHGIDPIYFSGVERHLIASVMSDFRASRLLSGHMHLDWMKSLGELEQALEGTGAHLKVGVLPNKKFKFNLVSDFIAKCGITTEGLKEVDHIANNSFHAAVIEATVNSLESGYKMPGPHNNAFYINSSGKELQKVASSSSFIDKLKAYIDSYFSSSNELASCRFNLPSKYFESKNSLNKSEILSIVRQEESNRSYLGRDFFVKESQLKVALIQSLLAEYRKSQKQINVMS